MAQNSWRARLLLWYLLALATFVAYPATLHALPVTFVTALPVAQDEFIFRTQATPTYGSGIAGDLIKTAFPAVFTYGLTTRITLFATVDQSLAYFNQHTASGDRTRSSSGFDDSLFFVRYTLLASQTAESLFRVTPFVGAYLPTGSYQKSDQYGRLPPFLQTGSGAVDPYFGWAGLMLAKQWGFQWDTTYRYNTPASPGFTLGDTLEADAHFGHLLYPLHLPDGTTNWLWAVVESNLYWYQPSRVSGRIDDYTGGTLWLIDPGLEYYSVQWVAACVIRVPLFEQWNQPGYPGPRVGFFLFYQYEFTMPHWLGDR
jgi:hypothetical protein